VNYFFSCKEKPDGKTRHPDLYLRFRKVHDISWHQQQRFERGILVITGPISYKHLEFVFVESEPRNIIPIPDHIWDRFHDQDQITQWQEKAFPRDKPQEACRRADGHLADGEPVFFLTDESAKSDDNPEGLIFLGRAQMFRFPYDLSPEELVPAALRSAPLDLAEAMFGRVSSDGAIKGRVFFEDAVAQGDPTDWLEPELVPQILSSPKVTTFQHYLTQDGTRDRRQLTTYLHGDHTSIRGHKLYWHRWQEERGLDQVKEANNHNVLRDLKAGTSQDTQHTIIRPVKAGVTFKGRVRFDNLTDLELGALLAALQLPDGCAHKLGMGRPLGLGSVRIETSLQLVNREQRYARWQDSGVVPADGASFRQVFTHAILEHARSTGETLVAGTQGLRQVARLDALFLMLQWVGRPTPDRTAYMNLDRFRDRLVLPTPHWVAGREEPAWPDDPPRPASGAVIAAASSGRAARSRAVGAGQRSIVLPRPGEAVQAELLAEKTKRGGWRARHVDTGLAGPIHNSRDVPIDSQAGDTVTLIVASANEREIAFQYPSSTPPSRRGREGRQPGP